MGRKLGILKMQRPRLTKRIRDSLSVICDLARNDMETDEDRFTADDWAGIDYLHKLIAWHKEKEEKTP